MSRTWCNRTNVRDLYLKLAMFCLPVLVSSAVIKSTNEDPTPYTTSPSPPPLLRARSELEAIAKLNPRETLPEEAEENRRQSNQGSNSTKSPSPVELPVPDTPAAIVNVNIILPGDSQSVASAIEESLSRLLHLGGGGIVVNTSVVVKVTENGKRVTSSEERRQQDKDLLREEYLNDAYAEGVAEVNNAVDGNEILETGGETTRDTAFSCDESGFGYFAHTSDCSQYHFCAPFKTGSAYKHWQFACEEGKRFDPETLSCSDRQPGDCQSDLAPSV